MSSMRCLLTTFALMVGLSGCDRRERFAAPDSMPSAPAPVAQRVAYISVSDLSPDIGSTIVVAGNVRIGDSLSFSSFRVRLGYDARGLTFLDEVVLPGMMRVVNPQDREVVVAGASSEGSADGKLFALRFRVEDPAALGSLVLMVDELNDRDYTSQVAALTRSSRLLLDKKLLPGSTP